MSNAGKILVTGGAGYIGSHTVKLLQEQGMDVLALDNLSTGHADSVNCPLIVGDLSDKNLLGKIFSDYQIDAVIHFAAIASVQASVENPVLTHQVNFDGTLLLLEMARITGIKRFLFASSAAVYGDASEGAVSENSPVSPLTPYAIDKLACEYYLKHYYRTFGMECTAFRFFNVYGPRQNHASPYSGVISIFASNSMAEKPLKIFGDGMQTRDFVYVKDVARILVASITNQAMIGEVVNIGTGRSTLLRDIIEQLSIILKKSIEVGYAGARPGDIRHSLADITLLRSLSCEVPSTSITDGLIATIHE